MVIEFYKNNMVWLKTNINVSDFSMTDYDSDYFYASNDEQKSDSLSMRESFTSRWLKHHAYVYLKELAKVKDFYYNFSIII